MEQLVEARKKVVEEDFGFAVMQKAVENMTCEIPEAMIEDRVSIMLNEYDRNLMARGMRLEEYIRMSGMDLASFQNMLRPQAEAQVKTDILLAAVAEAENIQVTDEEIDVAVSGMAKSYKVTVEQIKEAMPTEAMADDMKKKKANDLVIESAVAGAPEEEKPAKAEKPAAKKTAAKKTAKKTDAEPETAPEE